MTRQERTYENVASRRAHEVVETLLKPAKDHLSTLPSLVRLQGRTLGIGDLHGDLDTATKVIRKYKRGDYRNLLFLGDYIDKGKENVATIDLLFELMLKERDRVFLLRGNHEILSVNAKQGLKGELEDKGMGQLHGLYNEVFSVMPVAAVIDGAVFAVHGGIPEGIPGLSDIRAIKKGIQDPEMDPDPLLTGLLWNDPDDSIDLFAPNEHRGQGDLYGPKAFRGFMDRNGLERMVRAHQRHKGGYAYFFDKGLVSIFSCKSYDPNQETKGAVVEGSNITVVPL